MISTLEVLDWLTARMRVWGIEATADQRDIQAPGAFVTVTKITDMSLDLTTGIVHGDIILMTRDVGGRDDLAAKDDLLARSLANLAAEGVGIGPIRLAEQATPPDSSPLPAIAIEWSIAWTTTTP